MGHELPRGSLAGAAAITPITDTMGDDRRVRYAVPEDKLVEAVREVLARHGLAPR